MAKIYTDTSYVSRSEEGIAGNSVAIENGEFVSKSGGFVIKTAAASGKIVGIANVTKTYASNNQTVAKAKLSYTDLKRGQRVVIAADASITQADEGKFYNLNDTTQTVDVATASTIEAYVNTEAGAAYDPVVTFQVKLVKFVDQTNSVYEIL